MCSSTFGQRPGHFISIIKVLFKKYVLPVYVVGTTIVYIIYTTSNEIVE